MRTPEEIAEELNYLQDVAGFCMPEFTAYIANVQQEAFNEGKRAGLEEAEKGLPKLQDLRGIAPELLKLRDLEQEVVQAAIAWRKATIKRQKYDDVMHEQGHAGGLMAKAFDEECDAEEDFETNLDKLIAAMEGKE